MSGIQRIYRRNPLAFPGRAPGIDLSHPAAQRISQSIIAVPMAADYIELNKGGAGKPEASPSFGMDGAIGYCLKGNDAGYVDTLGNVPSLSGVPFTWAAILRYTTNGSAQGLISVISGLDTFINGTNHPRMNVGTTQTAAFALTSGHAYLVIISAGGPTTNFLALDLSNGSILTDVEPASGTFTIVAGSATVAARGGGTNSFATGSNCGPIFCGPVYLTIPQMLAWAADPWSFWYPPTVENLIFQSLKAPSGGGTAYILSCGGGSFSFTGSAAAFNINELFGSGTYTYTGTAATLKSSRNINVSGGIYTFSGSPVTLVYTPFGSAKPPFRTILGVGL